MSIIDSSITQQTFIDLKEAFLVAKKLSAMKYLYNWPKSGKPFIEHFSSDPVLSELIANMTIDHHSGASLAYLFRLIQYYLHNNEEWETEQAYHVGKISSNSDYMKCIIPLDI